MGRDRVCLAEPRGLTLLEVVLAMSILAVIVVLLVGTLRVGLRAWEAGQRQAAAQQEVRAAVELITEVLSSAYPYRGRSGGGLDRVVLFEGEEEEVRFITTSPPLVLDASAAAFHAVALSRTGERLRLAEKLVPAEEPFTDGAEAVLSRSVTGFRLSYRDDAGAWQDRWDGRTAAGLPTAVRVELTFGAGHRARSVGAFVVPIALGKGPA